MPRRSWSGPAACGISSVCTPTAGDVAGRKKSLGFRALAAHGIRMGLRKVRGGLAMNEHELLATVLGIDAPGVWAGH